MYLIVDMVLLPLMLFFYNHMYIVCEFNVGI